MECWVPLLKIFLNSPCPETEASIWLQKNFNISSNTIPISTTCFVYLLTKSSKNKRVMWVETLPPLVQARILSFLAYDHHRFSRNDLCKLSRLMLSEGKCLNFWVKKAAQRLLDLVSESNYQWLSHFNLDSGEENTEDQEFYSMPDWLKETTEGKQPIFPWLPMSPDELRQSMPLTIHEHNEDDLSIHMEEKGEQEGLDEVAGEVNVNDHPLHTEVERKAKSFKSRLLNMESTSELLDLTKDIRELCFENKRNSLLVLTLIEPWSVDDETTAVLISQLSDNGSEDDDELDWPAHILCSIVLPKFLVLNKSSSHVLMAVTIEYCKAHQRAAEYALLFPLLLKNEGINNYICDAITRIVSECLHLGQVSAFCQKLLCLDRDAWRLFVCLPCHRVLITEELVWTESLFCLWKNILNHNNVRLMENSVTELIRRACEFSERYSKSLKFGNFLLCLVSRCGPYLKPHKILLVEAVEKTESLVTNSVLSKLYGL